MVNWSEELELGIEIIDNQHKDIFEQINLLSNSSEDKKEAAQTYKALSFIEEYVRKHFKTEEFFLYKYEYPYIENHMQMHDSFSKQLEEFKSNHKKNGIDKLAFQQMMKMLLKWWYKHILEVDKQYVEFILPKIEESKK